MARTNPAKSCKSSPSKVVKRSVTRKSPKSDIRKRREVPQNVWKDFEAKRCESCKQTTHTIEKQSPKDVQAFVLWCKTKKKFVKRKFVKVPAGKECHRCTETRHFLGDMTQEELNEAREKSAELDDLFWEVREDRCGPRAKVAKSSCSKHVSEQAEIAKDLEFVEGTWTELFEFCRLRRLPYEEERSAINDDDFEKLEDLQCRAVNHIEYKYPDYQISKDKKGRLGVVMFDMGPLQHRVRVELGSEIKKADIHMHDQDGAMNDSFEMQQEAMEQGKPRHWRRGSEGGSSARKHGDSPSYAECSADESLDESSAVVPMPRPTQTGPSIFTYPELNSHSPRADSSNPDPRTSVLRRLRSKTAASASLAPSAADDDSGVEDEPATKPKKRRTSIEKTFDNAKVKYDKGCRLFTWQNHWESKSRKRDVTTWVDSLNASGRKLSALHQHGDAQALASDVFKLAETIETRQDFFELLRKDFLALATRPLSDIEIALFREAPVELLSLIVIAEVEKMIMKMDGNTQTMRASISVMSVESSQEVIDKSRTFNLSFLKTEADIEQTQRTLGVAFAERVWKLPDIKSICDVGQGLIQIIKFLPLDMAELDPSSKKLKLNWSEHALVSLNSCAIGGIALDYQLKSTTPPRSFRKLCASLVANRGKLNHNVRSLFKHMTGVSGNHGKAAWEAMEHFASTLQIAGGKSKDACHSDSESIANRMEQPVNTLVEANSSEEWSDPFDAVVDIINEPMTIHLVKGFADECDSNGDANDKRCVVLLQTLTPNLLTASDIILKESNSHSNYLDSIIPDGVRNVEAVKAEDSMLSDGEEDDPLHLQLFRWQGDVLALLVDCSTEADALVIEAKERVSLHIKLLDLATTFNKGPITADTVVAAIQDYASVWTSEQNLDASSVLFKAGNPGCKLKAFVTKMITAQQISKSILSMLVDMAGNESQVQVFIDKFQEFAGSLPKDAADVWKAASATAKLFELKGKLDQGKSAGSLLDLSSILDSCSTSQKQVPRVFEMRRAENMLKPLEKEWEQEFSMLKLKVDKAVETANKFISKFGIILDAVGSWTFESCPWVLKEDDDEDAVAENRSLYKGVETAAYQFGNWKGLFVLSVPKMDWASEECQEHFKTWIAALDDKEAIVRRAALISGSIIMVRALLKKESGEEVDMVKLQRYIKNLLKVDEDTFHEKIKLRMGLTTRSSSSSGSSCNVKGSVKSMADASSKTVAKPVKALKKIKKNDPAHISRANCLDLMPLA